MPHSPASPHLCSCSVRGVGISHAVIWKLFHGRTGGNIRFSARDSYFEAWDKLSLSEQSRLVAATNPAKTEQVRQTNDHTISQGEAFCIDYDRACNDPNFTFQGEVGCFWDQSVREDIVWTLSSAGIRLPSEEKIETLTTTNREWGEKIVHCPHKPSGPMDTSVCDLCQKMQVHNKCDACGKKLRPDFFTIASDKIDDMLGLKNSSGRGATSTGPKTKKDGIFDTAKKTLLTR